MRTTVIGTGILGAAMAGRLAREGHDVTVWNRTVDKAAALAGDRITATADLAAAVSGAEVVLTVLFDGEAVLAVADEIVTHLADDAVWVQASTVGPEAARRIGEIAPGRILDAPVLGTRKPAEDGTLVVLASGPAGLIEAARPVLDSIGRTIHVGDQVGQGSALKMATNAYVALVTAATAQSLGMARAFGLDPQLFLDAITGGAVDTPYAHLKGAAMLAEEPGPVSFALDGVVKDLDLMIASARAVGLRDDLLSSVHDLYADASARGHGAEDLASVIRAFDG